MQHTFMQCATRTHAAHKMCPPSVQYASVQRALAQHSVQPHTACNTHPCSTQLTGALHTGAAGATLTRNNSLHLQGTQQAPSTARACREGWTDRHTATHTHSPQLTPSQHPVTHTRVRHQRPGGSGGWASKGVPSRAQQTLRQQPQQQRGQARRQQQQQQRGPHGCSGTAPPLGCCTSGMGRCGCRAPRGPPRAVRAGA